MSHLSVLVRETGADVAVPNPLDLPAAYFELSRTEGPRAALERWADDVAWWRGRAERKRAAGEEGFAAFYDAAWEQRQADQETFIDAAWSRLAGIEAEAEAAGAARAGAEAEAAAGKRRWEEELLAALLAYDPATAITDEDRAAVAAEAEERAAREEERRQRLAAGLDPLPDRTWLGHLLWLRFQFGDREFTTTDVRVALAEGWTTPPQRIDPAAYDFTLRLGQAYGKVAGQLVDGWLWLMPGGATANRRRWKVEVKERPSQSTP
jgi:hypothetical protein